MSWGIEMLSYVGRIHLFNTSLLARRLDAILKDAPRYSLHGGLRIPWREQY